MCRRWRTPCFSKGSPRRCRVTAVLLVLGASCPLYGAPSSNGIGVSPSGHYVTYKGRTLLLVGDSGTQVVTQDVNIDYRRWIDDCAARGIRAVHVWSFVAPRQDLTEDL